jgi:hypothetical protein
MPKANRDRTSVLSNIKRVKREISDAEADLDEGIGCIEAMRRAAKVT